MCTIRTAALLLRPSGNGLTQQRRGRGFHTPKIRKLAFGLRRFTGAAIDVAEQQPHTRKSQRGTRELCRVVQLPHSLLHRGEITATLPEILEKMQKSADRFDTAKVRPGDVARTGGPPPAADEE